MLNDLHLCVIYTTMTKKRPLILVIWTFLGGIVGVGFAFVKELLNNTFRTKDQLEAAFGIQVLGVIPEFEVKEVL